MNNVGTNDISNRLRISFADLSKRPDFFLFLSEQLFHKAHTLNGLIIVSKRLFPIRRRLQALPHADSYIVRLQEGPDQ